MDIIYTVLIKNERNNNKRRHKNYVYDQKGKQEDEREEIEVKGMEKRKKTRKWGMNG